MQLINRLGLVLALGCLGSFTVETSLAQDLQESLPPPPSAPQDFIRAAEFGLRGAYVTLQAFKVEQNTYTSDFYLLGWLPHGVPAAGSTLKHKIGFLNASNFDIENVSEDPARKDTDALLAFYQSIGDEPGFGYDSGIANLNFENKAHEVCRRLNLNCTATSDNFLLLAIGNVDDDSKLDIRSINDSSGTVVVISDDLVP